MISEVHFLLVNVDKLIKNQESKNRNTFQSKISTSRKDGFQRTQKIINDLLCHYSPIVNHFYVIFLFMLSFHQCVLLHVCSSMLCTVLMSRFFWWPQSWSSISTIFWRYDVSRYRRSSFALFFAPSHDGTLSRLQTDEDNTDLLGVSKDRCWLMIFFLSQTPPLALGNSCLLFWLLPLLFTHTLHSVCLHAALPLCLFRLFKSFLKYCPSPLNFPLAFWIIWVL